MRLQEIYTKKIIPEMMKEIGYKNPMAVPKIEKVVINCGFGSMAMGKTSNERKKIQDWISENLAKMTGQKPLLSRAKKSVASFKLRKGMPIGLVVTLRKKRAYEFLEKLIGIILPRSRDFNGIALKSITEQGNLTIGLKDYTPFPEVKQEKEKGIFGIEITVVTTAKTKNEAEALFRLLGMPLQKLEK